MTKFQCTTCQETLDAESMMKHLNSTRHKTVKSIEDDEELNCEECQDNNNIHQLQIIRIGGEDIILICNSCVEKKFNINEKPKTSYSLSNGAILKYWDNYTKVRDCSCKRCGNESNLNVNLTNKQLILCDNCLKDDPKQDSSKFVSEKTGKFLYTFLGIKETSSSSSSKFKRKGGGRKIGRGKKRGRGGAKSASSSSAGKKKEKKPLTFLQKLDKEALKTKKLNSTIESGSNLSLKSFKGFKATTKSDFAAQFLAPSNENVASVASTGNFLSLGNTNSSKSSSPSPIIQHPAQRTNTRQKPNQKQTKSNPTSRAITPDISTKGSKHKGPKVTDKKNAKQPTTITSMPTNPQNKNSNTTKSTGWAQGFEAPKKVKNMPKSILEPTVQNTKNAKKKTSKAVEKTKQISKKHVNQKGHTESNPKPVVPIDEDFWSSGWDNALPEKEGVTASISSPQPTRIKQNGNQKKELIPIPSNKEKGQNRKNQNTRSNKNNTKEKTPIPPIQHKKERNPKGKSPTPSYTNEVLEEGVPIKKFVKYTPKLTYPDLRTYCDEFSYALFLEQKLENDFIQNFDITWSKDKNETVFVVSLDRHNNPEIEKLIPPALAQVVKVPFNERQPLMLSSHDESLVWYSFIKEVGLQKNKIVLLLELFSWNKLSLPTRSGSDQFKLLPISAQANRILFAMTRIKNPKFIDLLLGLKPIKQLIFNNKLKFNRSTLNDSQKLAVQHVLNNSITVIQGPPGTGKTSTIEEIILQLIENFHSFPILCVAASNIAIDNIAEKIMESRPNIKILRILSDKKESQYGPDHPLGKICLHNKIYERLSPEMKDIANKFRFGRRDEVSKNQDNKYYQEKTSITNKLVAQTQIIFTTNITAGGRQLKVIKELPVVIMDESTQSSEASTLVPLSLPGIKKFVFVGDEKQLSSFSNIPHLEMSLFERILANGTYEQPHMLDTQYRMHPQISKFPIHKFYYGELKDGVTAEQKQLPNIKHPLFFYQSNNGYESTVENRQNGIKAFTYNNKYECQDILKILYKLILEKNVKHEEIGIITPYSAQRDLLSELLVADPVVNPYGRSMEQETDEAEFLNSKHTLGNDIQSHTVNIINGLHVATVDSFQGHEKNFIIFSCVRNNPENKIGFLRDRRRLNVALTRSKNGLILVGNKEVLKKGDNLWRDFMVFLEKEKVIFDSLDDY
ncbi:RNA helicase NDAI_0B02320 [Naumovozyma dairenensis CBS 421]|uniref:Uncharacterized protein n=1 Tax=Naumovozyma dairenensis (strain ATCC 10597 / BCRC 20456 / CBS 421 / NBRC 0211 / NRRL Y-12639) TaxID=1071378 RepID=G0W656_NAUDC|nr:hypothetical protein NDAI_0B02320 [Naumovozyma dairenensis CBS 421]CCD23267.1 hypothetical protein NDAI_0B02320 [Naumovozyma dairenensis CBS 421]